MLRYSLGCVSKICADDQYAKLVKNIITYGDYKNTRNGVTVSNFGEKMVFSLKNNTVPILTTKKLAWKTCLKELLWFIKGDTDNTSLKNQNVKIWNQNASRDFLNSRNLKYEYDGDLGPIYGHQWRHFNAKYKDCKTDYSGQGIDQLQNIINSLKSDEKYSRRLVISAWNPVQLDEMALPPCHILSQFNVNANDELSCALYQRSGDVGLGIPFNIASYSFLTCLLAKHCDLRPNKLVHFIGDAHIYKEHLPVLSSQIQLKPFESPTLNIDKQKNIDAYNIEHFHLENYKSHPSIKMDMNA